MPAGLRTRARQWSLENLVLAECAVVQRSSMQKIVLSLLEGSHPERIPSVAAAEAARREKEQAAQGACVLGCVAVAVVVLIIVALAALTSK